MGSNEIFKLLNYFKSVRIPTGMTNRSSANATKFSLNQLTAHMMAKVHFIKFLFSMVNQCVGRRSVKAQQLGLVRHSRNHAKLEWISELYEVLSLTALSVLIST